MPTADEYRIRAAELYAQAKEELRPVLRGQCENLALAYLRLADQAEKNSTVDLVYETPSEQPQSQQQQQPQPEDKVSHGGVTGQNWRYWGVPKVVCPGCQREMRLTTAEPSMVPELDTLTFRCDDCILKPSARLSAPRPSRVASGPSADAARDAHGGSVAGIYGSP